jgi:hypothetical protein
MRAAVKSLLLVALAGLGLALGVAAPAGAATPCSQQLINDWFDGHIDHTYPIACYQHLPQDVEMYSGAKDDIHRAMLAALRQGKNGGPPTAQPGHVGRNPESNLPTSNPEGHSKGLITKSIEWLGPSDAASVPLPLLILAGVAFLLLAAAGGSLVNRRLQERRLPPNPGA